MELLCDICCERTSNENTYIIRIENLTCKLCKRCAHKIHEAVFKSITAPNIHKEKSLNGMD